MHGLYWLAVELSARVPLLVCVDDAQWADAPSLRWLAYLSRRLEGVALLLLVGRRDGEPNALLDQVMSEARAEVLRPCPLSEDAVEQWVANAYGQAPAREFAHECWRLSGGNPLLLGELVAQLQAEGLRPDAASGRRIEGVAPDAISRSVLARLARQGADAVAVAEAVAVLSQDARVDRVATLAGVPVARVAELADRLADAGILRTEEPLAFAHPVLRTAVYEQIGVVRRGLAHATAARMLLEGGGGVEHAAAHLQLAPVVGQSWAVEALRAAARAARSRGAPDAAVPLLRRVLAENPRDRTEVLLELARAEATARDPAALDHAREVVMSGTTATQRVHGAFVGAEALLDQGHGREAVELLESANGDGAAVEANLKLELAARTLLTESFTGFSGLDAPLTALGVDDLVGGTAGERLLLALRAIDLSLRACPRRTSLRIARRVLAREDLAAPAHAFLPVMARALTLADELDEARATLTQVIDGARRRGSVIDLATGCAARSDVEYRAGRLDGAEADARQALVIAIEHNLWLLPAALAWTVEVLLEREPPATVWT